MALLGNYSALNKNPGRALSGSTVADSRGAWSKSGAARCRFTGWAGWSAQSGGTPSGATPPKSWVIAIRAGGGAARTAGTSVASVNLAGGKAIVATAAGSSTATVTGGLIVQIIAAAFGSSTATVNVGAVLGIVASASGSSTGAATLQALGAILATAAGDSTGSVTVGAVGQIIANTDTAGDVLTAQQVADEVWAAARSSGGDDTMGEALRLALAIVRNRVVTDPAAGTYTVFDDDGVTVLISGDLWQDAAGTVPYAGAGAERRDRLT